MTLTLKNRSTLSVPVEVQRRAGIKPGDRLEFKASSGIITITLKDPVAYKPTKSELAAIRKGEAAIARGQSVSLTDFLHGLDSQRRKTGTKASRKTSR
jgi:bifunctional DNA-binding transcriptional regulator/antitoxin component of YhaV-PrlF toxin-antitoxin module